MTIKNGDLPAMPLNLTPAYIELIKDGTTEQASSLGGLTKREQFAAMAMQGLLANGAGYDLTPERLAESSLAMTDALLAELERSK